MSNMYDFILKLPEGSKKVLSIIQKYGPIGRVELIEKTGFKMTKILRLTEPLEESDLVLRLGEGSSTGGRKPMLFDINTKKWFIAGFSIATSKFSVSISNLKSEVIVHKTFDMEKSIDPSEYLDISISAFYNLLEEKDIEISSIIGVGISAFGSIDRKKGIILKQSVSYLSEKWVNYPIVERFEERLKLPAALDIGVVGEMLAYHLYNEKYNVDNLVYLSASMSIRMAVISRGIIVRSTNDSDDALGHMTVKYDGKKCTCGNYGCIECYSTVAAITSGYTSALKLGRKGTINKEIEEITFIDIAKAADEGEQLAADIITEAASVLACGLANYINLVNVDIAIISGLTVRYSKLYYEVLKEATYRRIGLLSKDNSVEIASVDSSADVFTRGPSVIFLDNLLENQ